MSWRKIGSGRYYQHTYRDVDGRVRTLYYGRGPVAEWFAGEHERLRDLRVDAKKKTQAERTCIETIERTVVEYCWLVDELHTTWMRLIGLHSHHGQWRKNGRITRRTIMSKGSGTLDEAAKAEEFAWWLAKGEFDAMMMRYNADMAANVIDTIIAQITDDPYRRQCIRLKVARLQREIAGVSPSVIEKVLAEQIAVCYIDSNYSNLLAQSNCNLLDGDFCQRRQTQAQRRYLRAIKTLADCRKVAASTIQDSVERLRLVG